MTVHPLESVSADEVETAVKIFREHHPDEKSIFSSIALKEPNKSDEINNKKVSSPRQMYRGTYIYNN